MMTRLLGPMEVFPGCHLWLAVFGVERASSPSPLQKDLAAAQMSSRDVFRWQRFRPEEKKRQFLNSRLAVRSVLHQELGSSAGNLQFDVDSQRRPLLLSADGSEVCRISLSHSGPVVAVAISRELLPVGVDIETVTALRTDALRLMAANPGELDWWHETGGTDETEFLRTLWTVKESVWKSLRCSAGISVSEISVECDSRGITPRVLHRSYEDDGFQTRLFASQCEPIFRETLAIEASSGADVAFRGCVSLRLSQP